MLDLANKTLTALSSRHYQRSVAGLPPGPKESPLDQMLAYAKDPVALYERCHAEFGDLFTIKLVGGPPAVHIADPAIVKQVFGDRGDTIDIGDSTAPLELLTGRHFLLRLSGPPHRRQRKLMMPAFHGERLGAYGMQMRAVSEKLMAHWRTGDVVSILPLMQEITLAILLETVFGIPPGPKQDRFSEVVRAFLEAASNPLAALTAYTLPGAAVRNFLKDRVAPWLPVGNRMADVVDKAPFAKLARYAAELDDVLFEQIHAMRRDAGKRDDVMALLASARDDEGKGLTDDELRDEMMGLLVAGHETTATTLTWAVGRLLSHEETRDLAEEEVARVLPNGSFDPARVRELEYIDAAVKETLRLHPVVPVMGRVLQAPLTIAGYSLPAGVMVTPSAYLVHRSPKVWKEPLRFDPSRFVKKQPPPWEWFPFGGGVHLCIGMAFAHYEMRIILSTLLQTGRLQKLTGPLPSIAAKGLVLGPSVPIEVRVGDVETTHAHAAE